MAVTDRLVLPPDVMIVPADELSDDVRSRLDPAPGDYAITRPGARGGSKLVSRAVADLVQLFRTPQRVVEVTLAYARDHGLDPHRTLADAFPAIRDCYNARLLVPEDSPYATRIAPSLERGARVERYEIVRHVHVLEDVEVYQVKLPGGGFGALKLLRPGWTPDGRASLEREAAVLAHLGDGPNPRLLECGEWQGNPYLATSWCAGISPLVIAGDLRSRAPRGREMLDLCGAIVAAYVDVHRRGVVHGDVHPDNVLITSDGRAVLLDFALARLAGHDQDDVPRGAVPYYLDPDLAAAWLAGTRRPPATTASDQFGLGAMLYLLLTGDHYLDFALDESQMLEQIVRMAPLPFANRGAPPWPEVERLLGRALRKHPEERYPSVGDLAASLEHVAPSADRPMRRPPATELDDLLTGTLQSLGTHGELFRAGLPTAPTCSVTYGAAGIAYALYRIAGRLNDASLLFLGDSWVAKAVGAADSSGAFHNPAFGVTPDAVSQASLYHHAGGLHCVAALTALAMGDGQSAREAITRYLDVVHDSNGNLDFTLGSTGTLVGSALLLDVLFNHNAPEAHALRAQGDATLARVWDRIGHYAPIGTGPELITLGIAHGWAGILYATLRWCRATGQSTPAALDNRLAELANLAEPAGRGVRWPWPVRTDDGTVTVRYMPGWCQGTAGYVHLWLEAARTVGTNRYDDLAEQAAWHVWEAAEDVPTLCCGLGGRAYALLALYRRTGDDAWLERAISLANRAAAIFSRGTWGKVYAMSLYKGQTGLAALAADLLEPEGASMPMFEDEGWPSATRSEAR